MPDKPKQQSYLDRQYRNGLDIITRREAIKRYPRPIFYDKPNIIQTKDCLESELLLRIKEIRYWLDNYEQLARGKVAGRVTKECLLHHILELQKWRAEMTVMAARAAGEPIFWEL